MHSFFFQSHHSFTFNLRFLFEMKLKVRLSKSVRGAFQFSILSSLIKAYYFCLTKSMDSLTLKKVLIPFKIKIFFHSFAPRPLIFKL